MLWLISATVMYFAEKDVPAEVREQGGRVQLVLRDAVVAIAGQRIQVEITA